MSSSFIGKVLDNYRILERLGIGGMGVVFKAIHIKLDKVLALKIIAPGLAMNEHFIKRFQTEAKALAKFEDPNIVRIYDLRSADDQWFIVMEYVEGTTLTDKILKDGALQWLEALPIIKQVLSAIGHAHEAGIIHRDIKPNNIMLNDKGNVKITDFGLAKDQTKTTNTISVTSGGTLYYMSPEHVKGFSFIDARSDLYSIGMTFYEMLTGIVPFQDIKSDFDIRESIIRKEFDKPQSINPAIPSELENIVMKSISKNPDDRYQTADDLMQAILEFESQNSIAKGEQKAKKEQITDSPVVYSESVKKKDSSLPEKTVEPMISRKKRPVLQLLTATLLIIAVIIVIFLQSDYFSNSSSPAEQIQEKPLLSQLTVSSTPASAWIILNGDSVGQTPLSNHTLQAGQYTLTLSKEHYYSIDTTISLTQDSDFGMVFTLQKIEIRQEPVQIKQTPVPKKVITSPAFSVLHLQSDPSDSEIWLNGKLKGKTPLRLTKIIPGTYLMEIRKTGYEKYTEELNLIAGNNQKISSKLTPFSGRLSVIKDPPSATVLLDGKEMSGQNLPVLNISSIAIGEHHIEVAKQGYASLKEEVEIKHNEIYTLNARLIRLEGNLNIQVRPWGSIYINGKLQESSADIKHTFRLPVEQYEIKVEHPTLGYWQKNLEIREDEDTNVIVNFTKQIEIQIAALDEQNTQISGEIFVDGKNTGQSAPATIKLRTGVHKIGLKKDGYIIDGGEKVILINTGMDKSITFILKKTN